MGDRQRRGQGLRSFLDALDGDNKKEGAERTGAYIRPVGLQLFLDVGRFYFFSSLYCAARLE